MDYQFPYPSPLGLLFLESDGIALTGLSPFPPGTQQGDLPIFRDARNWLDAYFRGDAPDPRALPLAPRGTPFQRAVWEALLTIPHGQTVTYGQIAGVIGKPRACQAVGQAVGRNPIGIIIPCHRVIGAQGQLTGFAWGLDQKKWLLRHEGVNGFDHQ